MSNGLLARISTRAPLILAFVLTMSLASFFVVRAIVGGQDNLPPEADREWLTELKRDEARPRFPGGVVSGIRVLAPKEARPPAPCSGRDLVLYQPYRLATGTPFEITPAFLPPGAKDRVGAEGQAGATELCGDKVIAAGKDWNLPSGSIDVRRMLKPEPYTLPIDAPQERISAGTVATRPAILVRPILKDGRGGSMIVYAKPAVQGGFIVTEIHADGLPFETVLKVAEGLNQ